MEISNVASPFKYVMIFIVMILVQVLVCNNILLFGVAVPFIFIFFIVTLPLNLNPNLLMTLAFALGLIIDLFSDSMGLNSLACLLLSVVKKPIFYAYMPKEDKFIEIIPSICSMGWFNYIKFILSLTSIFCILVFGIELFSFASFGRIVLMAASSTVFTVLLLMASDAIVNHERGELI